MSVVVPFPGMRAVRGQRARVGQPTLGIHPVRGGSVISWVRPAHCSCCGRPTLAGPGPLGGATLCGHCTPPSAA
jgi:hypothetical protein